MITVGKPWAIAFTDVTSWIVSPTRHAPHLLMRTVWLGVMTTPMPSGTRSFTIGQAFVLTPDPVIALAVSAAASAVALARSACAAADATGPAAAAAAACAVFSATFLAPAAIVAASAAAAAAVIPSHAGWP